MPNSQPSLGGLSEPSVVATMAAWPSESQQFLKVRRKWLPSRTYRSSRQHCYPSHRYSGVWALLLAAYFLSSCVVWVGSEDLPRLRRLPSPHNESHPEEDDEDGCHVTVYSGGSSSSSSGSSPSKPSVDIFGPSDALALYCKIPSFHGGVAWKGVNGSAQERTRLLGVSCQDAAAFPTILSAHGPLSVFPNLETLWMDACRVAELADGAFRQLSRLRELRLTSYHADWPSVGTALTLDDRALVDLPELAVLDLGFNDIRTLTSRTLCPLAQLTQLNLTSNKLQDLNFLAGSPASTSSCVEKLQLLDVSQNRISQLPAVSLSHLKSLTHLQLQGNLISALEDTSLSGLRELQVLNIAHNRISSLPPGLFTQQCCRNLSEIYANANGVSVLAPGLLRGLERLLVLDLADNQLTSSSVSSSTFAGLQRLVVLHLQNNRLTRLDPAVFSDLAQLQILRLDGNALEVLPESLFTSTPRLHTLLLSRNRLTQLDAQLLAPLHSLTLLAMDNNALERIHEDAFHNNTLLQDLNLSGNNLSKWPTGIRSLTQLRSLDLGENQIRGLDENLLAPLRYLTSLRLLDNSLGNITKTAFASLPSLRILNLSKNRIHYVEEGAFAKNLELQAVRLDANYVKDLTPHHFAHLPHLAWLNMSDNRLEHFDYALIPKSLQWLDIHANLIRELGNYFQLDDQLNLQTLDASFNRLTELTASMLPDSLQILSLNDNLISHVQPYTFFRKDNLTRVDLYANQISDLDQNALRISPVPSTDTQAGRPLPEFYIGGNPFQCDCNMEWIQRINTPDHLRQHPKVMDLESIYCRLLHSRQRTYVPLVEATPSNFLCTYETHCFALCHCCDFDACDCEMTCPTNCTCYHDQSWSANIVDCSAVGHTHLPERIPMDATELYLDGNNFQELASHKFIGRKNLRILFLNGSNVEIIHNRTFNGVKSLQILHLEDNRIAELHGFEFGDMEGLHELYLHNNALRAIHNATFSNLKVLEILRLDGNQLMDFAVWPALTQNSYLVQLNLGENPWSCACEFVQEFRRGLRLLGDKVTARNELVCVSNDHDAPHTTLAIAAELWQDQEGDDGTLVNRHNQSIPYCIPPQEPAAETTTIVQQQVMQDYLPLLVTTLVAFLVLCLLLLLGFVYRYPVRVWCYARYGVRLLTPRESVLEQGKLFDAFISYSAKDDSFVQQMLASNLEYGSPSYKLCLQHRDCPVSGAYMAETIAQAVDASKRTILVISQNLMKAEWCRFEYKSALHQVLKSRRKCLVVILVGDIPQKDLDPDLKLYLKTNTCLQWGDKRFWDKLRFALPDVVLPSQDRQEHESSIRHANRGNNNKRPGLGSTGLRGHRTRPSCHTTVPQLHPSVIQSMPLPLPLTLPPTPAASASAPARSVALNMNITAT